MSNVRDPETDQALPIPNDNPSIHDMVAADLESRKQLGIRKYTQPLQAQNGRDNLQDAYDEALDLCVYLKAEIETRRLDREQLIRSTLSGESDD